MIETKSITFSYGELSFNFPDISCKPGEVLLITGGSGKGKTTFLHLLGGLLQPDQGDILIQGINLNSLTERKRDLFRGENIGLVFQQSHFVEALSVLENVVLASWLATGKKHVDEARDLLIHLGLEGHLSKLPAQLSVGQQQRVSIARALINKPQLLLADEPTSSLDDENAFKVATLLFDLAKEFSSALIIVTHDQRLKDVYSNQLVLS